MNAQRVFVLSFELVVSGFAGERFVLLETQLESMTPMPGAIT